MGPENPREDELQNTQLMLDVAKNEYSSERERKRDLETRAGILIALVGVLIGIVLTTLDFSLVLKYKNIYAVIGMFLLWFFILIAIILLLISLFQFIKVLKVQQYGAIDLSFIDDQYRNEEALGFQFEIADSYKEIIIHNRALNEEKVIKYNWGINFFKYAMVIYLPLIIIVSIVKAY